MQCAIRVSFPSGLQVQSPTVLFGPQHCTQSRSAGRTWIILDPYCHTEVIHKWINSQPWSHTTRHPQTPPTHSKMSISQTSQELFHNSILITIWKSIHILALNTLALFNIWISGKPWVGSWVHGWKNHGIPHFWSAFPRNLVQRLGEK